MKTLAGTAALVPALMVAAAPGPCLAQSTPIITTFAGTGTPEPTGDDGLATQAGVGYPYQIAADALGNIYFSEEDPGHTRIRRVDGNGVITTVVGGGTQALADGALADQVLVPGVIQGFAVALNGDLYFGVFNRIWRVDAQTTVLSTYAGGAAPTQFQPILRPNGQPVTVSGVSQLPLQSGDDGPATGAYIDGTGDMLFDAQGDLVFIAGFTVRKVNHNTGTISTVAGTPEIRIFLDDPNAQSPGLVTVGGLYSGDGGPASEAGLGYPSALAIDSGGNLYIYDIHIEWQSDPVAHTRVRRIAAGNGSIDAYAGSGVPGFSGDNGAALQAQIGGGWGLAVDSADNLYISDTDNSVIRRVDSIDNTITTVAGTPSVFDFSGDEGPAASATFNSPFDIAFDPFGNLYISDLANARIRKVTGLNPDAPPTAAAGPDQSIHAGTLVALDGSASSDDNTASLTYTWSFASMPAGSAAVLADPAAAATTFTADRPGTYVVELVVEDSLGQASQPDQVLISSQNLAPTAVAGADQAAAIGSPVVLNGSASFDPEMDDLSYQWALVQAPAGSAATLLSPFTVATAFVPDLPGAYVVELVASDPFHSSSPDTVLVTAFTGEEFAENAAAEAIAEVTDLPPSSVTTQGNQQAIVSLLASVIQAVQSDNLNVAVTKLQQAIERTDGCPLRGQPDDAGPGRDWITDCTAQQQLYADLTAALAAITP